MSYAYIQGKEAEAVSYFETLLKQPLDPRDRAELEALVRELRQKVQAGVDVADRQVALQNAPALNLQTC